MTTPTLAPQTWMGWQESGWLSRHEPPGSLVGLADRILEAAQSSDHCITFLKAILPDLANEFAAQWVAVGTRQPQWEMLSEFGRRTLPEVPWPLAAETLDREAAVCDGEGGRQLTVVPLTTPGRSNGVLFLGGRSLGSEQLPNVLPIARAMAYGLVQARENERHARRTQRLRATLHIAAQFATVPDSQQLLERIAQEATRLLESDRASIFIWDKDHKSLIACPALGMERQSLRIPDNVGIVGEVVQTGKSSIVDNAYADPRFNKEVDLKTGYKTRNLLCVPLLDAQGHRIGAFEVINKVQGHFDQDDEDSLKELGIQAAIALQNAQEREQLLKRHRQLTDQVTQGVQIVGQSAAIDSMRKTIDRLAQTDLPVLVLGESGTGKEVVAQSLHYRGSRREHPFVAVNCAALPDSLLETELFGHEKGAFTDARDQRQGKFELADGGTLFLDEIGDMSLNGQAKLLRVLEQKVITRVGGSQNIPVNVRIVAATNANLVESIRSKKFREDLYYRLSVVKLDLPPLRERPEDILLLADHFLLHFCKQANRRPLNMSPEARQRLQAHNWPGNIRELRNLMERVAFLCAGDRVETTDLAFILSPQADAKSVLANDSPLNEATAEFQREHIRKAIHRVNNNMSEAAKVLGLHRSNLYRKMRQLEMTEASDAE